MLNVDEGDLIIGTRCNFSHWTQRRHVAYAQPQTATMPQQQPTNNNVNSVTQIIVKHLNYQI